MSPRIAYLLPPVLVLMAAWVLPAAAAAEPPVRVLMLDYHAPAEHDVLLSHLCVDRCTRQRGCPEDLIKDGVDYWSEDFVVYRPQYLGRTARFVVDVYKSKGIDFVSISGHHASGFSGNFGRGSFDTEKLAKQLWELPGRDDFFTGPGMVMLHGCWTDVKSGFEGDPIEYVRHILDETTVRPGQSERLLAAVHQIAGDEEAYRELFPNACILGYSGTQIPGGRMEIYGQVHGFLRGLAGASELGEPKWSVASARGDRDEEQRVNRGVDQECGRVGWPCNLCRQDADTYSPLKDGLVRFLRSERTRIATSNSPRGKSDAARLEQRFEEAALYSNTSWSCAVEAPGTPPVYPRPIDRAPFAELFLDLLMVDFGAVDADTRGRLEAELVHLLGSLQLDGATRDRIRRRLADAEAVAWRRDFMGEPLRAMSTFRQRDFFDFFAEVGFTPAFEDALHSDLPRVLRENAASQLRPSLGRRLYERSLGDPSPRVRLLAASRLEPELGVDLLEQAARDDDDRVRASVRDRFPDLLPPEG
ncbi:MAG: HEAT repeat domain-containing protein [Acidobacteriota bacterium]